MSLLPPELSPPKEPTIHRHQPKPATGERGFQVYRSCLRWDFGFTCAFCLLHETDFSPNFGAAGTGQMSIEHFVPQTFDPELKNEYANCIYACMFCNRARSNRPIVDAAGRRLLDPSKTSWAEHFLTGQNGRLRPREEDLDAAYTHSAYDLDAPGKVERRSFRKQLWSARWKFIQEAPGEIDRLLAAAEECPSMDRRNRLTRNADWLNQALRVFRADLAAYPAIPPDMPSSCRCDDAEHFSLPPGLACQMLDLP